MLADLRAGRQQPCVARAHGHAQVAAAHRQPLPAPSHQYKGAQGRVLLFQDARTVVPPLVSCFRGPQSCVLFP